MSEAALKAAIHLALGRAPDIRLFNNPVGNGWAGGVVEHSGTLVTLSRANRVAFGLAPGSADLIGWRAVKLTSAMVGKRLAVFTSIEVKSPSGRVRDDQRAWSAAVTEAGGIGLIVRSVDEAVAALRSDVAA